MMNEREAFAEGFNQAVMEKTAMSPVSGSTLANLWKNSRVARSGVLSKLKTPGTLKLMKAPKLDFGPGMTKLFSENKLWKAKQGL